MKCKVGDLILVKKCDYEPRPRPRPHPHLRPRPLPHLHNTIGIITEVEKHSDIFEKDSTENDNGYIWYSQVDGRKYYFYEDEVIGEGVEVKYKVGDLLFVKKFYLHLRPRLCHRNRFLVRLENTVGIITEVEKHTDIFESRSTPADNGYIWYSQLDNKEYHFYEDEAECEVIV